MQVADLRCEYLKDPLGIDAPQPRLSWIAPVRASAASGKPPTRCWWPRRPSCSTGTGRPLGQRQSGLRRDGPGGLRRQAAGSRQACFWKVRAWDRDGQPSAWSKPARWEMGLLEARRLVGPLDRGRFGGDPAAAAIARRRQVDLVPGAGRRSDRRSRRRRPLLPLPRDRAGRRKAGAGPADPYRRRPFTLFVNGKQVASSPSRTAGSSRSATTCCRSCAGRERAWPWRPRTSSSPAGCAQDGAPVPGQGPQVIVSDRQWKTANKAADGLEHRGFRRCRLEGRARDRPFRPGRVGKAAGSRGGRARARSCARR